jgi:hypothetical protein
VYQYGAEDEFPAATGRGQFVPGHSFDTALMA